MKRKKLSAVILITLIFPALVFGQTERLSLEQARQLALQNSRSLARLNLSVQSSVLSEKTQKFSNYPTLSLGASARGTLLDWKEGFSADVIKDSFSVSASAGVTQRLFEWNGSRNTIDRAIAGLSTESARQSALEGYYNVLNSVDSAYYTVLEAQAGLEAAENSLETAALSLSIAEIRRQNGMYSETDYLRALAEKESRENSRNQSRRELSIAKLRFSNLLGINETVELEPVDFESLQPLIQGLAGLDDAGFERLYYRFRESIEQRNPGLVNARISLSTAEKNLDSAQRSYLPTVSASVSTGLNYNLITNDLQPSPVSFSLNATIPLDFWAKSSAVERSRIALSQSTISYQNSLESTDIDLQVCLSNLIFQAGQILSSARTLDYYELLFDHEMELYRLGQSSQSSLSTAEGSRRSNRNQYDRTRYSFLSALSTLRSLGAFDSGTEITMLLSELGLP